MFITASQRPHPLVVEINSLDHIRQIQQHLLSFLFILINNFWPGDLQKGNVIVDPPFFQSSCSLFLNYSFSELVFNSFSSPPFVLVSSKSDLSWTTASPLITHFLSSFCGTFFSNMACTELVGFR